MAKVADVGRRQLVAAGAVPLMGLLRPDGLAQSDHAMREPAREAAVGKGRSEWSSTSSRELIQERYFPDVALTSHEGRTLRFYQDLLKDRVVMINMMYATCQGVCPVATANLVRVQKLLGPKVGSELFMYSISLKPEEDTPEALRVYADNHGVGAGWLFLTGAPRDVELLRWSLGFVDPDPKVDSDKLQHTGMVVYGNEARELWAACPATGDAAWIVESVGFVM